MKGFTFPYRVKILEKNYLTHNVIQFLIQKPYGYFHKPGQAIELSIDKPGYELDLAPFTITNLNNDPHLELTIKVSTDPKSLTYGLASSNIGEYVQITESWDSYQYKVSGIFIAAGTGITPFIHILKELEVKGDDIHQRHLLLYANRSREDILFYSKLRKVLGKNCIHVLSRTKYSDSIFGKINLQVLKQFVHNYSQFFYICGPIRFEKDISQLLLEMGVKKQWIQTGHKF